MPEQITVLVLAVMLLARVISLVYAAACALPGKPAGMRQSVYDEYITSRARHGLNS